jgi:hypothetical protein
MRSVEYDLEPPSCLSSVFSDIDAVLVQIHKSGQHFGEMESECVCGWGCVGKK